MILYFCLFLNCMISLQFLCEVLDKFGHLDNQIRSKSIQVLTIKSLLNINNIYSSGQNKCINGWHI